MINHSWLLTMIPFLFFIGIIVLFEIRAKRREKKLRSQADGFTVLAKTAEKLFEYRYGRPSTDLENAFPEIRSPK